jgi:hypothetical protein
MWKRDTNDIRDGRYHKGETRRESAFCITNLNLVFTMLSDTENSPLYRECLEGALRDPEAESARIMGIFDKITRETSPQDLRNLVRMVQVPWLAELPAGLQDPSGAIRYHLVARLMRLGDNSRDENARDEDLRNEDALYDEIVKTPAFNPVVFTFGDRQLWPLIESRQSSREQIPVSDRLIRSWLNRLSDWKLDASAPRSRAREAVRRDENGIELTEIRVPRDIFVRSLTRPGMTNVSQMGDRVAQSLGHTLERCLAALKVSERQDQVNLFFDKNSDLLFSAATAAGFIVARNHHVVAFPLAGVSVASGAVAAFRGDRGLGIIQDKQNGVVRWFPSLHEPESRRDALRELLSDSRTGLLSLQRTVQRVQSPEDENSQASYSRLMDDVNRAKARYWGLLALSLGREAQFFIRSSHDQEKKEAGRKLLGGLAKASWLRAKSASLELTQDKRLAEAYLLRADAVENRQDPFKRRVDPPMQWPDRAMNVVALDSAADRLGTASLFRTLTPVLHRIAEKEPDNQLVKKGARAIGVAADNAELELPAVDSPARQRLNQLKQQKPYYTNATRLGIPTP